VKVVKFKLSTTLESYLEKTHDIQKKYGAVRVTDLATEMGCRLPSVTSALRRLAKLSLVNYEAYRPVTLTKEGLSAVRKLSCRHRIIADFLIDILALPKDFSEEEACKLEHRISVRILNRLGSYVDFIRELPDGSSALKMQREKFLKFLGIGSEPPSKDSES